MSRGAKEVECREEGGGGGGRGTENVGLGRYSTDVA